MLKAAHRRRAQRALDRQLAYQRRKAANITGREAEIMANMQVRSRAVREALEAVAPLPAPARVLEVGSGAHGLIFFFDAAERVGVDPLADHYRTLFPLWQGRARTIASGGETLPFPDGSFDAVLCDNVVDHADSPRRIVEEIARVLAPGGLLYFTVNIHHPFYQIASNAHGAWRAAGIPLEITPFADHTVHLTRRTAEALFGGLPLRKVTETDSIAASKRAPVQARHMGDRLKRLFFKNARYDVIAVKETSG